MAAQLHLKQKSKAKLVQEKGEALQQEPNAGDEHSGIRVGCTEKPTAMEPVLNFKERE